MLSSTVIVGLTGPIGSGKSEVARLFCQNGYKLIDADKIARMVVEKGSATLDELALHFGADIINEDGTLCRTLLAKRAFSSQEATQKLNDITHPAILSLVKAEIENYTKDGCAKIIYDAPLLFESGSHKLCDVIVTVIAQIEQRISRVKSRDNMSESDIKKRLDAQHSDSYYTDKSDYVIENNSSYEELVKNTLKVIFAIDEVQYGTI